jgi:hypothetical protein
VPPIARDLLLEPHAAVCVLDAPQEGSGLLPEAPPPALQVAGVPERLADQRHVHGRQEVAPVHHHAQQLRRQAADAPVIWVPDAGISTTQRLNFADDAGPRTAASLVRCDGVPLMAGETAPLALVELDAHRVLTEDRHDNCVVCLERLFKWPGSRTPRLARGLA